MHLTGASRCFPQQHTGILGCQICSYAHMPLYKCWVARCFTCQHATVQMGGWKCIGWYSFRSEKLEMKTKSYILHMGAAGHEGFSFVFACSVCLEDSHSLHKPPFLSLSVSVSHFYTLSLPFTLSLSHPLLSVHHGGLISRVRRAVTGG